MKLLPLTLVLAGAAAGLGAGHVLAPKTDDDRLGEQQHPAGDPAGDPADAVLPETTHASNTEVMDDDVDFVRLNNQFIVPIISDERVTSLIVISLALETEPGVADTVYQREPKLRDAFLDDLFAHARSGGFAGSFTDAHLMADLRQSLLESARRVLGGAVKSVLLNEIVRQDLS
ncbi:MAG: flagellar basal body-associated FliL family protein [Pseudomonadota bacterium]